MRGPYTPASRGPGACPSTIASTSSDDATKRPSSAGGPERIARQHKAGKKTARERHRAARSTRAPSPRWIGWSSTRAVDFGMDEQRIPGDGVVTGSARIHGRPVFVFAQDFTVFGGSLSEAYARKICKIMDLAMKTGTPDRRAQRLGRRAHPGGRGLAGRLRRHLPAQYPGLGRRPADLGHHGAVRGRRGLLARHHRLRVHGQAQLLHVRDRARRDQGGDPRGGLVRGAGRRRPPTAPPRGWRTSPRRTRRSAWPSSASC